MVLYFYYKIFVNTKYDELVKKVTCFLITTAFTGVSFRCDCCGIKGLTEQNAGVQRLLRFLLAFVYIAYLLVQLERLCPILTHFNIERLYGYGLASHSNIRLPLISISHRISRWFTKFPSMDAGFFHSEFLKYCR